MSPFHSFSAFWMMGGYALYVWPTYLLAFLILVINSCSAMSKFKRIKRQIRKQHEDRA